MRARDVASAIRHAVAIYVAMDRRDWAEAERAAAREQGLDPGVFRRALIADLRDPDGVASTYLDKIRRSGKV